MSIWGILLTILIFGVVIFIHELGHFLAAKASGIKVNEFALGMGPAILKKQGKETLYALRLFPIGGYCSMEGEDEDSQDERSFGSKPVYKRMAVVVAGAFMNLVLGFVLLLVLSATQKGIPTTVVETVAEGSPAAAAGLEPGDEIVKYNGSGLINYSDLVFQIAMNTEESTSMVIERGGEKMEISDVAVMQDGEQKKLGITVRIDSKTFFGVIADAAKETAYNVKMVWTSLIQLITGQVSVSNLSGPVGVAEVVDEAVGYGWQTVVSLAALITVNLGVFNLLPFPALDGGRFVFLVIEAIRRKPIKKEVEAYINFAGLALLMLLMVVITVKDVFHLFR